MRREVENVYPLSPMQKGMLFHSLLEPQSEAYFEQVRFDLHGNMDVKDFEKSVNDLVKRHAIFRTNFYNGLRDEPLQVVYKNKNIEFNYKDLRKMNEEYRKEFVNKIVREDRERGFNLAQDSLIRMVILHIKENTYHLIWSFHHILMDGWCLPLIFKELFENYYAIQKQRKYNCAPVIPYSQYVEWLEEQDQEEASNYWSTYLAGYQEQTLLPKIKSQGMDETYVSEKIVCNMGKELTKSMKRVANDNHVTINTLLQTAWGILLQKYNNSKDVVFGSVVSGRPEEIPGIENMIGLFINTIPVRIHHEEEVQFAEAMKKNQELALASHVYDTYPLYEIQALTEQQQNLINHIMVFENYPAEKQMGHIGICNETALEIANLEVNEQTNYDFNLIVMPGEEIHIHFQYNANVYEQATIERIQGHMIQIIKQVVNNPNIKVSELKLLTEREKTQILDVFNKTEIEYSNEKTIHQLFEEQVQRTPNQVAVVFEDQQLTYQELNERANQLARTLKAEGVRAEQLVAIMAERSLEMIIGILGILKSGGAYVPIDPEYPEERIQYMLKDSKAQLLLLQHHLQDRIPFEGKLVNLNDEASYHKDGSNLKSIVASNQLAYVIYTSGTTGKPKGVMVEHHGLCNLKSVMYDTLQMNEQDKVVQFASLSFDASIWEIFTSLFFGATLYIPSKSVILDYHLFNHFMNENKITTALLPPAYATYLEPNQIPALKKLVTGGSASSFQLVEMWKDKALYVNAYGPTEDSIITTMWSDSNKLANNNCIPIGCPIHNHQVYIMDKGGQLLPIGVAGELCIAGSGVARGYLNRPGLTKEKFVENPFNPGEKMYKTGDLARWLPDGNIEYLGRMDHQVKIRGYRIETGEVETALLEIELIQEAIIIAKEDKDGLKQLCAYYVGDDSLTVGKLRSELSKELPNYMIPSYFVKLTQMPLTPNGKVDRKALLELEGNLQTGTEYEAPRTVIEVQLAEIWKEVLGLKQVGVKDNFFDIGGHSLRATILISKIHKEMNVSISLREIFRFPTLQQMAGRITDMEQHIYVSIPSAEEREYYPVSSSQKRMYILNQLEGGEISYNITNVITVKGDLDCKRLEEAFRQLIQRHESLRTGFEMVNGKLMQRIETNIEFSIEYMKSSEKEVDNYVRRFVQAFNLQQAPLMRVGLIEIEPEHYLLLLDMHHIISDGISMNIIMKEWIQLYEGEELPPLRIGYKDYAVWQQKEIQSERMKKQETYWLDVFSKDIPLLDMPTDYVRPSTRSFTGDSYEFIIDEQRSKALRKIAKQTESTLYMVLLGIYTALLSKYSGQEDIIVGSPIAGRPHVDLESTIGMFVNTLAMRNYPVREKSFTTYLQEVKENALKAYENQDYPFEELVDKVNINRDMSRNPVFDTMFVLQNMQREEKSIQGLQLIPYVGKHKISKFDLTLIGIEEEGQISCMIEYATNLYKEETIKRMSEHFMQLIDAIIDDSHVKLSSLEIITSQEKTQILDVFNKTEIEYSNEKTIHQLFEEQVQRTPNQVAVVFEDQQLTYQELNERANQLARTLKAEGVRAEQLVAIMAERSLEMIIGILGVLKSGGAYVPIDPEYPEERIQYMLKDSKTQLLLLQHHLQDRIPFEGKLVNLNDEASYHKDGSNLESIVTSNQLAYVIYTSGSTGRPKGIMVEHLSIHNFIQAIINKIPIMEHVSILCMTTFSFDIFVLESLLPLVNGLKVVMADSKALTEGEAFNQLVNRHSVEVMQGTPSRIKLFMNQKEGIRALGKLKMLMIGGEAMPPGLYEQLRTYTDASIYNMYGPTETTVWSSIERVMKSQLSIGKPIANTRMYIMDDQLKLQPIGVRGELCIAGDGVTRGYLNRPDLTKEKFVENPFISGEKMYKTGDLARWLPDGSIEYLGRSDHQVKIRGYRIETGEVETALLEIELIQEAIIIAREDKDGLKQLCAYYVGDDSLTVEKLRSELSKELPNYMIPSYFVKLTQMPLTPNGKVDRKALLELEGNLQTGTEYEAPRTVVEVQLAEIWKEVLGLKQVGVKDNFFDIGGHSLKATALVSKVYKEMNVSISLREIFRFPTLQQMAGRITDMEQHIYVSIPSAEEREYYPVSSSQKRMYILNQLEGGEISYNITNVITVKGDLNCKRLEEAFRQLIQRHESLRTGFEMVNGKLMQRIETDIEFSIEYMKSSEQEVDNYVQRFVRAFNLQQAPLIRVGLIEIEPEHYLLLLDMHHIISDGVSMNIIMKEWVQLYEGEGLLPLRIGYKDYAVWQQKEIQSERMKKQETYWLDVFSKDIPLLDMPTDYVRPSTRSFTGDSYEFIIDEQRSKALRKIAKQTESTLYMVLLGIYTALLSKYSGQEDIIVGSPIAGRPHVDLESTIGMFVNTLAMRNYPVREKSFTTYLQEVKENALKAYENQDYPFEELVDKVNINRDMSRNPVFDTMFVLQNMQQEEKGIQGLQLIPYVGKHKISKFDLTLIGIEEEGHVSCMIEYATALYKEETIKRMSEHFMQLIDAIINDSQVKLSSLEIITPQEKAQILDVFNKTAIEYSSEKTIHQLFEEQVQRTPNQVAVVFENQQLTYQELNERANQLARTLRSEGVRSEQLVAIMAERSLEMIIGILGVLKAGGAYVPIDPEYPEERIQYMLKDSKAQLLLLQQHLQDHIPFEGKLVNLNDEASYHKDGSNLKSIVASNQLAYVIYTSGTTGKPKGVMVEHHGLCNLKSVMYDTLQMNEQDKVVQFASLSFDASIWEIFTSLFFGATLYIPSKSVILDYHLFNHFMNENKITTATLPPAYATYLEPTQIPFLRKLITAGSSSSIQLVNKWRGHVMYVNAYGPTEDSICSTVWTSRDKLSGNNSIPIGRPIHNHQVYIMDKTGQLLPIGVAGELCIAGLGVARGYLNRPDLTKEKFVENPFVSGEKMYKTGDLARWLTDGSIEYLGRIDHQVKIRGNRIEIGEVETALLEIESIQEVIVIAREDKDGLKQLCAYYVGDDSLTVGKLRNELSKKLPNYIIPSYFVKLTQMPLTPNGKVDRKALPKLGENVQTETEYEAPRTAAEVQLVEIWKEVLGLEQIGIKENFFDIGGHSLKVLQLIRKVSQSIGVNLPYRVVFDTPTIETMAQQIMTSQLGMEKNTDFLKLNDEGDINVFCFPSTISGLGMEYFEMAKRLENQCILYAYDFIEYHSNYTDMINEYVESIISIQKQGPYVFLGYSAGGNLAFEIAKVMEKSGLEISDIIMLDTSLMNPEMQRLREKLLERDIDNNENISEWFKQVKDIPSVKNKSYCYEEYMKQLDNNGIVKSNIHNLVVKGLDKSNWLNATMKNYIEYEGFGNHNEMLNRKFIDANVGIIKLVLNEIIERNVEMNLV